MRKTIKTTILVTGSVWLASLAAAPKAEAQAARQKMEQCVNKVLTGLAKQKLQETQVGSAVLTQCDAPLRATLAEAIRTGEAGGCTTVEGCLDLARSRAAAEAITVYRQMAAR